MPNPQDSLSPDPATPTSSSDSAAKHEVAPTTPKARPPAQAGATPKSAPATVGGKAGGPGSSSQRKKAAETTLLGDFLLGRPSPARVAAQRAAQRAALTYNQQQWRRQSVGILGLGVPVDKATAGVRQELRQEMRAAAVRKLQQPGRVHDRVKAWQKANVADMAARGGGVPAAEDVATEPTEIAAQVEADSVGEEDRVRIKWRQKQKKRKTNAEKAEVHQGEGGAQEAVQDDVQKDGPRDEEGGNAEIVVGEVRKDPRPRQLPKKRIVSDDNWMKRRKGKSPPRARAKAEGSPTPIPKDFLLRTAQNPSVQSKIKDWATRVEVPTSPQLQHYQHTSVEGTDAGQTDLSSVVTADQNVCVKPSQPDDDGIRVKPLNLKPKARDDDGIRVKPTRKKEPSDDRIRAQPAKSMLPDDGIRIRPGNEVPVDNITVQTASSRRTSPERSRRASSTGRAKSQSDVSRAPEEANSEVETPTRRKASSRSKSRQKRSPTVITQTDKPSDREDWSEHEILSRQEGSPEGSRVPPTVLGNSSLLEIPVGLSAFSELDLPLGAKVRTSVKKPKAQRNSSLKAVPKAFKKVVNGAKEIIQEKVEQSKSVANQPPNIESWLNDTVDPFVESSANKTTVDTKKWVQENETHSTAEVSSSEEEAPRVAPNSASIPGPASDEENSTPRKEIKVQAAKKNKTSESAGSTGLKRSRATRSSSSPFRFGGKKPFRETLKEAFRGESGGHKLPPTVYPSYETAVYDSESERVEEEDDRREIRRHSDGLGRGSPSPESLSTTSSGYLEPKANTPGRRKPPTNGLHALSTIASEQAFSTHESDTVSTTSQTTVTQTTTAFTKSTDVSRQRSHKSGLKRHLTKHSDLVSVLSLPGNDSLASAKRNRSLRSSRSLHRNPSRLDKSGLDDLLQEFADEENLYQRELKTLVDGVVPVLLTQVVNGDRYSATDLFEPTPSSEARADTAAKSVVNMGIALEKLKNCHKRVPLSNVHHLLTWLDSVYPIYDSYLDVWRLGFHELVVNLAPALGRPDDDDSLLNALPRNEDGDVVGEDGERVNVAHLLKRPLIRVKWMTKFLKAVSASLVTHEADRLLERYETLQEKARKRHREETARLTDKDANETDTTRVRDLRNLSPLDSVVIDQSRQVAAKDSFSLDLVHSSGQRLGCHVELIRRDNPEAPTDRGDILFRDIGSGALRPWLLFQPVPKEKISARIGEKTNSLVVMVRGTHKGEDWYELIELSTTNDDGQITDWLDILGTEPVPPASAFTRPAIARDAAHSPRTVERDVPVGERSLGRLLPAPQSPTESTGPKTPSRYHGRNASVPSTPNSQTPTSPHTPWPDKTPTQEFPSLSQRRSLPVPPADSNTRPLKEHMQQPDPAKLVKPRPNTAPYREDDASPLADDNSRPLKENMRPGPAKLVKPPPNTAPYREDGAPPPPIHQTLGPKSPGHLVVPPVDLVPPPRVKRRTSSPLKHEYHPSDISSDNSSTETGGSSDDSASSSDELSEDDVPDTIPGFSIKGPDPSTIGSAASEASLEPSNSASQVGSPAATEKQTPERMEQKFVASVSYWCEKKGLWKDISADPYSIVVIPGGIEVHHLNASHSSSKAGHQQAPGKSDADTKNTSPVVPRPLIALGLTPVVMIRRSTSLDLEVRGKALPDSRLNKLDGFIWRFRTVSAQEAKDLYDAVHHGRLNNAKYIALAEEARVRAFGQMQRQAGDGSGDGDSSSHRRGSWFGRKNSYRASTRAPTQSQHSSSTSISASSFLRRLMGGSNQSFNIDRSTLDKQSRPSSAAGGLAPPASLYTSSGSSSGYGGTGSLTPPRSASASVSLSGSGWWRAENGGAKPWNPDEPLMIRCHLGVNRTHWADKGSCILHILRPPPGVRQELSLYNGLEKRIVVTRAPKKADGGSGGNDPSLILLDAVLGSKCFSMLGTKGIMCSVWEDLRDEQGRVGIAPRTGALSGRVTKWCFQCHSTQQAGFILAALTSEIPEVLLA